MYFYAYDYTPFRKQVTLRAGCSLEVCSALAVKYIHTKVENRPQSQLYVVDYLFTPGKAPCRIYIQVLHTIIEAGKVLGSAAAKCQ